ncbi:transcriptional regulator [Aminobacter anthyllidis]|uniref:Transcriptional regulator n=1 Tax=Aminobacter anthyllidis TaxID=1035067 RepID=A0A9X1A8S1_9HYPH|nr:transcriptional regulator [Aminobacter anthyllidis]MBT1155186.1 transcriptional regulator [Aminobacter anthyllidis]MDH4985656.1 transcriptional regulator [Aminobacter anthyllidis]
MKRKQAEAERARAQHAELTKHYRAIGPAAILAALICAPKKEKTPLKLNKAA